MNKIAFLAPTSAIAMPLCRFYADLHKEIILIGRDLERLAQLKNDLLIRGAASVQIFEYDCLHPTNLDLPALDLFFIAAGYLGNQNLATQDFNELNKIISTNFSGIAPLLHSVHKKMMERKEGMIAVITSIAGDKIKRSNYIYGTAKAALSHLLIGLRAISTNHNIHILDIKLGPTHTPMTLGMEPNFLWISPEDASAKITKAIYQKKKVVYIPGYWRPILQALSLIPTPIFNKLGL